jgi:uncharacterized membrane protein YccC
MLSRARASLVARDANYRALRRGLRVALVVPLTLLMLTQLPWISQGALFGVFSCLALLVFADFGGDLPRRATAYLATTAAGIPLVLIGAFAGQALWSSVLMMAVVAMIVGVLGVLRGPVTSAQSALLLATVITLTASSPDLVLPDVAAWVVGGLIATVAATLLWPARSGRPIRRHIADTLDAVADAVSARWGPDADRGALVRARQHLNECVDTLHSIYDGDLARPSGLTSSERALAELVDEISRLRYMQKWEDLAEHWDSRLREPAEQLAEVAIAGLSSCSGRLRGEAGHLSPRPLMQARQQNLTDVSDWLDEGVDPARASAKRQQIDDMFPLRITNLVTSRIIDQTIALKPQPGDEPSDSIGDSQELATAPPTRPPGKRQRLRAHLSWDSPWFRNALRSAVALSLSIAVAKTVNLEHPFWIVLGTLSALRFDALGTGRTARQALVGTTAGVVIGAALIWVFGPDPAVWWAIFPVTLFFAAYTPGTFSLAVGQAAFSLVVIVMFSIVSPARLDTATARLVDVALGLAISLVVSVLMWPRGVVQTLSRRFEEAMTAACDFYVASVDWMAGGAIDGRLLAGYRQRSFEARDRATEALDLSIAQRPPEAVQLGRWTMFSNTVAHVDFSAGLTGPAVALVSSRGSQKPVPDPLVGPMLAGANHVRDQLLEVTQRWCASQLTGHPRTTVREAEMTDLQLPDTVISQRRAIDAYLTGSRDWIGSGSDPRPVIITWLTDWSAMLERGAQVLARSMD